MGKRRRLNLMAVLPEEIIEEILYRLPPKALLRFKSVCKSWRCQISSPYFIRNHLNRKTSDFAHQNLILTFSVSPQFCLKSAALQSILVDGGAAVTATTILDYFGMDPDHGLPRIYGSCNGLILLTADFQGSVLLWNPSTRKARSLLPLHGRISVSGIIVYGFAYINNGGDDDDYKIVCIYPWSTKWNPRGPYTTEIYSLRNHSWKRLEDFYKGFTPTRDSGKFVNGRLHWIARDYSKGDGYIWDIVFLDLGVERYEVVPKPDCLLSEESRRCCYPHCLRVLGGNLALVCYTNKRSEMKVWVMKEYGVRESWVQILNISGMHERFREPGARIGLLSPTQIGDGVLVFGSTLIFYDGQNKLHDIQTDVVRDFCEANVYVETLVSPFGDGDDEPTDLATADLLSSWLGLH